MPFEVRRKIHRVEFVEIETGKSSDALDRRPQLKASLAAAKKLKCPVAVAKLDRLSGDVHFISGLAVTPNHKICRRPCPMISNP
jgi:DNA invertase Pin-like site-specific DNA recombinase